MTSGGSGGLGGAGSSASGGWGGEVIEPSLVVSAKGDYWQEGELVASSASVATLSVSVSAKKQKWHGFGGKFSEQGWYALMQLTLEERETVMRLLFSPGEGIGFEWGRLPVGPDGHAFERYSLSEAPGEFDVSHDEQYLIPYVKAAQAVRRDLKFLAVPWTPPAWAKVAGTADAGGYDMGLFDSTQALSYADYLVAWIEAYQDRGIPIAQLMPQQEPGYVSHSPSCAFGPARDLTNALNVYSSEPATLGPFVRDALVPALASAALETRVWFGSLSNNETFDELWESLPDASLIEGVGLHFNSVLPRVTPLSTQGLLVMQSMHWPGNAPFRHEIAASREDADRNNFLPTEAPNNHAYGEESWDEIKHWIDEGVNLYMAGNLVLDNVGWTLDESRPWPHNSLISVHPSTKTYEVTPAYYVFRHLAQYVDQGADVLMINGDALAFQNPDGTVVVTVYNSEESAVSHTIDIDGTLLDFSVPERGWATVNYSE